MTKRIEAFTLGTDPECFLIHKDTKDIVSAIPYIPGDKWSPYQIPELSEGHMIQTDNVMVEYCIPAHNSAKKTYESVQKCINWTNQFIPSSLEVVIQASARLKTEYLQDPQSQKFGCEPDFNAWAGGDQNDSPSNKTNLRTAGKIGCQPMW